MSTESNLKGKVALITGGGGGFGQAIAKTFANAGARVVITDARESGREIAKHVDGSFMMADLSDMEATRNLSSKVIEREGGVDILVNNAGLQHIAPVEEFPDDDWARLVQIMLIAPFQLTKYLVPGMKERGWGRIINLSSIHGLVASPFKSAYVSAKHGLVGFTRTVALELGEFGITVIAICPGYSNTPLTQNQIADQAVTRGISESDVIEKVMLEPAAIKRLVEPQEIASLALYLVSDSARSVTGTAIPIDAGWTAR